MIGVFLVPFLCVTFLGAGGADGQVSLWPLLLSIATTILLPMILGQLLRPVLRDLFGRHKVLLRRFNNGVILFIVWSAFCQSFFLIMESFYLSSGVLFVRVFCAMCGVRLTELISS